MNCIISKTIKQKYNQDCGIACLAMFLNCDYQEIKNLFSKNFSLEGINLEEIAIVLKRNYGIEPILLRTLIPNVKSIICVPSLGLNKKFHYVYYDTKSILDPAPHRIYSWADFENEMPMSECIVDKKDYEAEKLKEKWDMPTHLYNEFEWKYLDEVYKNEG